MPPRIATISSLYSVLLILLVIAASFNYTVISANGRATLISSQEKGPYRIDVSILPSKPVVENTHVSVFIWDLARGEPVTQARVTLSASGPAGPTELGPIPAPNDFTPQFFETNVPFDAVGNWQLTVDVASVLGEESVVVPMDVQEGGGANWILIAAAAVAVVTAGLIVWDRIVGRRQRAKSG